MAEWANYRGSPGGPMLAPCRGASRRNPSTSTPRRTRASSCRSGRPRSLQMRPQRRRRRGSRVSGAGGAHRGRAVSRTFVGPSKARASGSQRLLAQILEPRSGGSVLEKSPSSPPTPTLVHFTLLPRPSRVSFTPRSGSSCKIDPPHPLLSLLFLKGSLLVPSPSLNWFHSPR